MRKLQITIQLDPDVIAKAEQLAKDQNLAKQVAYEHILLMGLAQITKKEGV